jgi:archaellum biogenesis ATPase FlaH
MSEFIGHFACIGMLCGSSDALAVSVDDDGIYFSRCFSCDTPFGHNKLAKGIPSLNIEPIEFNKEEEIDENEKFEKEMELSKQEPITAAMAKSIADNTSLSGRDYRGIRDSTLARFRIRTGFDEETGEVNRRFYPYTENYKLTGYKKRITATKGFDAVGRYGNESDLFGEHLCKDGGRTLIIVGGEEDVAAAWQMLDDMTDGSKFDAPHVVSPTTGEGGCSKQIAAKYAFFDKFDKIIIGFDNDDAGRKATHLIAPLLPSGKVYTAVWTENDPCECIKQGKQRQFIDAYFKAMKTMYVPEGITSSLGLEDLMREYIGMDRLTLPAFMHRMQKMLAGGIPLGYIVNILSASGTGKSTFCDAMILHWIMDNPYTVGIVSLEASEGEYAVNLSSSYCGFKLNLLESAEDRLAYLADEENVAKRKILWQRSDGSPRFYLVDSDIKNLQKKIEQLVITYGCKVICLDPLQDIFDVLTSEEQLKFMSWQKETVKKHQIIFININHARKSGQGQKANSTGADLNEEDMHGVSAIFKSGGINIILGRNKEAENEYERNTTYAKISKARGVGNTGQAGAYYYENETHKLHDKSEYFLGREHLLEEAE